MMEILNIYTRVSTLTQQEEGTSLDTQKELGIKKAQELGFDYKIWNEGGASSNYENLENRPVLLELLSEIDHGNVNHLWVYSNDRLSRNDIVAQTIRIALQKHAVTLHTKDGTYDLNNPHDKMVKGLFDLLAQYDNALRSERTRLGKLNRVKKGGWMGGPPPYGYKIKDKKLVIDEDESKWVKNLYQWYANGKSIERIKSELDKNCILSRRKKMWSLGSIRKILQNTHHIGYYKYTDSKTEEIVKCECPAIVSKNLWDSCQKRRETINKRKGQINRTKRFYLLRDLLYCGHCGMHMSGRIKESKNEYLYYCPHRERSWVKGAPENEDKWKRGNGCDMNRSLNIMHTDCFVVNEICSEELPEKIALFFYDMYVKNEQKINHTGNDISILKARKKKLEKELNTAIDSVAEIEVKKLIKNENAKVLNTIINKMNDFLQETERKIEQVDIEIEQASNTNEIDPNTVFDEFECLRLELSSLKEGKKMKSFLESFINRITVFYDKDKKEHKLILSMRKAIKNNTKEFLLPCKKKREKPQIPMLWDTPLLNHYVTVE